MPHHLISPTEGVSWELYRFIQWSHGLLLPLCSFVIDRLQCRKLRPCIMWLDSCNNNYPEHLYKFHQIFLHDRQGSLRSLSEEKAWKKALRVSWESKTLGRIQERSQNLRTLGMQPLCICVWKTTYYLGGGEDPLNKCRTNFEFARKRPILCTRLESWIKTDIWWGTTSKRFGRIQKAIHGRHSKQNATYLEKPYFRSSLKHFWKQWIRSRNR